MELKQVMIVRKDLRMSCGKLCAQCCHASLEALEKMKRENILYGIATDPDADRIGVVELTRCAHALGAREALRRDASREEAKSLGDS